MKIPIRNDILFSPNFVYDQVVIAQVSLVINSDVSFEVLIDDHVESSKQVEKLEYSDEK